MVGAIGLMTATIPMIVATGTIIKVTEATFRRNGKPVGRTHWHYRGSKPRSHRHEDGHIKHKHKSLSGYGRTRKSLRRG